MLGTTLLQQLTENIGAGEEVRFSREPNGLRIRRIHGNMEIDRIVAPIEIRTMRMLDEYLGERLWDMAVQLRGQKPCDPSSNRPVPSRLAKVVSRLSAADR